MLTVDLDKLELSPTDCVLDLGCGRGRHLHALLTEGRARAVGLDLSFGEVEATRNGYALIHGTKQETLEICVGDVRVLPFADAVFDAVICSEVLEHIRDYRCALHEIARILKPGGRLAISVPRAWTERICWWLAPGYRQTPGGHVRIFTKRALIDDIVPHRFRHIGTAFAHGLHSPYWWLQCALWDKRESSRLVRTYHRFLVWDILKRPLLTRLLARFADPLIGKSLVLYFRKEPRAA